MRFYNYVYIIILVSFFSLVACSPFEKEIKQDQKLKYYRNLIAFLNDSISNSSDKIMLYSDILNTIKLDKSIYAQVQRQYLMSELYDAISREYVFIHKLDSAWVYNDKALQMNNSNVNLLYNKACLSQDMGADSIAMNLYNQCLQRKYEYVDLYYNRALLLYKKQQYMEAIADYQKAIDMNPDYLALVYNNQGSAYFCMKDYQSAINAYKKAITIDSCLSQIYINLGDTYLVLGQKNEADSSFRKAVELKNEEELGVCIKKFANTDME